MFGFKPCATLSVKLGVLVLVGTKQVVHWFLGGKGLGIQQRTSVWVGSPKTFILKIFVGVQRTFMRVLRCTMWMQMPS